MDQPEKSTISVLSEYSDIDTTKAANKKVVDATEGISISGKKLEKVPEMKVKTYFGQSQALATDILEFLILKTRLELGNNDKKKMFKVKEDFLADCLSNICNFQVRLVTDFFTRDESKLVSANRGDLSEA